MYVSVSRLFAWWLKGEELGQEERLPAPSARLILIDWDKYVGMVTSSNCDGLLNCLQEQSSRDEEFKAALVPKVKKKLHFFDFECGGISARKKRCSCRVAQD